MTAVFSSCRNFRYSLQRTLDNRGGPIIGFCLHNPSKADATSDDPTTRRAIGLATSWGASALIIVNPWAGIATDKAQLWKMTDPVGPENDSYIEWAARRVRETGGFMVLAWGKVAPPRPIRLEMSARPKAVEARLGTECDLRHLGTNDDGSPKHPLYLKAAVVPLRWRKPDDRDVW